MSLYKSRNGLYSYDFRFKKTRFQGRTGTSDRVKAELIQQEAMSNAGREIRPRKEAVEPGVYFLLSPSIGLIKVGCSSNMTQRLAELEAMNGDSLHVVAKIPAIEYRKAEAIC